MGGIGMAGLSLPSSTVPPLLLNSEHDARGLLQVSVVCAPHRSERVVVCPTRPTPYRSVAHIRLHTLDRTHSVATNTPTTPIHTQRVVSLLAAGVGETAPGARDQLRLQCVQLLYTLVHRPA